MKYSLAALMMLLLCFAADMPTIPSNDAENTVYSIQIGAFNNPELVDFENISKIGYVYTEQLTGRLRKVMVGKYMDKAIAKGILAQVQANGFEDAFITFHPYSVAKKSFMIQIATKPIGTQLNWANYAKAGRLYVQIMDKQVKIMAGSYGTIQGAKDDLANIRALGFSDAFPKIIASDLLHRVNLFESNGLVDPTKVINIRPKELPKPEIPTTYDQPKSPTIPKGVKPSPAPPVVIRPELPPTPFFSETSFTSVKRSSVKQLQATLKNLGSYNGSVDGMYGKGTAKAMDGFSLKNQRFTNYQILASRIPVKSTIIESPSNLQDFIDIAKASPKTASEGLKAGNHPLAKAYEAYLYFTDLVPTADKKTTVNQLMAVAIKTAFEGKTTKGFNHTKTYNYTHIGLLLKHIAHVQGAAGENLSVPCWLFDAHPVEARDAFRPYWKSIRFSNTCNDFDAWRDIQLLKVIAHDFNRKEDAYSNEKTLYVLENYARKRTQLYFLPIPLNATAAPKSEEWHKALWTSLGKWAATDPVHRKMCNSLKVAYYQALVHLENHFMGQKFTPKESRGLALSTLFTIVNYDLEEYK